MIEGILLALAAQQAAYTFTIDDPAKEEVEARLVLSELAPDSKPLLLTMPQGFAYVRLESPRLTGDVTVVGDGPVIERSGPYSWGVDPKGAAEVTLEWTVPLDHRSVPEIRGRDEYEYPYLNPDHGMLVMATMAVIPGEENVHSVELPIRVDFEVPEGWAVHAPWPQNDDGSYRPRTLGDLSDDLIAVGRWDTHVQDAGGMDITFAFAPGQEQLKAGVVERAAPVVKGIVEHFGGKVQDSYLVLFGEPTPGGYGGSPKTNSMTLFVGPDLPVDFALEGVVHLIAHEFHHTWQRAYNQPVDELRFVAEGFTDYFAYFVPWRIGMVSDEEFQATLSGKLGEAETAHRAELTSMQVAGGPAFFQGGTALQLVYAGGLVTGLWLDLALRQGENPTTLEEIMRAYYASGRWKDNPQATPAQFWETLEQAGFGDVAKRVQRITLSEQPVDWVRAFASIGVPVERTIVPVELSVRANFDGTTITAIDPSGCGGMIGLRSGDTLMKVNGIEVEDEAQVREAFPQLVDGEFVIELERADGTSAQIKAARPEQVNYALPKEVIEALRDAD